MIARYNRAAGKGGGRRGSGYRFRKYASLSSVFIVQPRLVVGRGIAYGLYHTVGFGGGEGTDLY